MKDPVQNLQFSSDEVKILKALIRVSLKIQGTEDFEGVTTSSKTSQHKLYYTAQELADHLGISKKTVYYRSAPKSANPWPFKVIRVGGSKRGRLRFKKSDVEAAIREGVV